MNKLLEKARSIKSIRKSRTEVTPDHLELVVAYLEGDVTLTQIAKTLERDISVFTSPLLTYLRQGIAEGNVEIRLR